MFKNQKSSRNSVRKYRYYALKSQYLPAGDLEEITMKVMKNLFDHSLDNILDKPRAFEFKSVNFDILTIAEQDRLVRLMVDKIVYDDNRITYFMKIDDLSYFKPFKKGNYLNTKAPPIQESPMDVKIHISDDNRHLIIENQVYINNRHLTNKFLGKSKKIISISENSSNLIKALSIGWRYGRMQENGMSAREIAVAERKTCRTIYRYMNLNYLSPNIVNNIMDSRVLAHVNLQTLFEIASKHADFKDQEKTFYNPVSKTRQ